MKLKYSEDLCFFCNTTANTKHCFSDCVLIQSSLEELAQRIILLFNSHKKDAITGFSWWFSTNKKKNTFGPDWTEWNRTWGDLGCMPAILGPWLQQHGFWKVGALLDSLNRIIQQHVYKIWRFHTTTWENQYQSQLQVQEQLRTRSQPIITQFFGSV